jgi:hypothetical protein
MKEIKNTSIRWDKDVHKQIRILAAQYGINVGEVIEGLLAFAKAGEELPHLLRTVGITDPDTHECFEGVFEQLFIDTMAKIEERRVQWAKSKAESLYNAQKRSEEE